MRFWSWALPSLPVENPRTSPSLDEFVCSFLPELGSLLCNGGGWQTEAGAVSQVWELAAGAGELLRLWVRRLWGRASRSASLPISFCLPAIRVRSVFSFFCMVDWKITVLKFWFFSPSPYVIRTKWWVQRCSFCRCFMWCALGAFRFGEM